MKNPILAYGAGLALLAVALGAFGAHGLKGRIEPYLMEVYQTAVFYHLAHALGVLLLGVLLELRTGLPLLTQSAYSMIAGVLLFSGSLYLMAVTGIRGLGAITPLGGVLLLVAWGLLLMSSLKRTKGRE